MHALPRPGFPYKPVLGLLAAAAVTVAALGLTGVLPILRSTTGEERPAAGAGRPAPAAAVQVAPAAKGAIASTLNYAGTIQAARQVSVVPKATGLIQDIAVEVGAVVHKGDVLATVDPGSLPAQLQQAQAGLTAAQAKLAQIEAGAKPDDVAAARAQLDQARTKLGALQQGRPEDAAAAQAQLDSARAKLALMEQQGRPDDVAQVQAQLDAARAKLAQLQEGGRAEQVASSQAAISSAQANLDRVGQSTYTAKENARVKMEQAANAVRNAQQAYSKAYWDWDVVQRTGLDPALAGQPGVKALPLSDYAKQRFKDALDTATRAVADAQNNLDAAKLAYNQSQKDEGDQLKAAQATLEQARQQASITLQPAVQRDIEQQQAVVRQLEASLAARSQPYTEQDLDQARATVQQAEQNLAKAQQPGSAADIQQQAQVVAQMQAQYQGKAAPYTRQDLDVAGAAVAQAEAQVAMAQANLDQMTIAAPFDGVVAQRLLAVGAFASSQTPILTLVGSDNEVHITLEEARLGLVQAGQTVQLTVPAYPGVQFPAQVAAVAPTGDPKAHTFDVKIVPASADDRLKPGMFAQVQVTAAQKVDAVLVPHDAVVQQGAQQVVFVVAEGKASARQVKTGITDGTNVEIISGINAGDEIVIVGQNGLRDGAAVQVPAQRQRQPGGAPGGAPSNTPGQGAPGKTQPGTGEGTRGSGAGRPNATPGAQPSATSTR